jgi:hypothetical protein
VQQGTPTIRRNKKECTFGCAPTVPTTKHRTTLLLSAFSSVQKRNEPPICEVPWVQVMDQQERRRWVFVRCWQSSRHPCGESFCCCCATCATLRISFFNWGGSLLVIFVLLALLLLFGVLGGFCAPAAPFTRSRRRWTSQPGIWAFFSCDVTQVEKLRSW